MNLAMSGATPQDAGLASGLVNTTAQVGGALGLAVLATLSTSRSDALIASGHPIASALTTGYHLAFWVAAALVGCALAVVLVAVEPGRAQAGARGAPHAHDDADADADGQAHAQREAHPHGCPSAGGARA
jgi:hypothetical protein